MNRARVDEKDVLAAARETQGWNDGPDQVCGVGNKRRNFNIPLDDVCRERDAANNYCPSSAQALNIKLTIQTVGLRVRAWYLLSARHQIPVAGRVYRS